MKDGRRRMKDKTLKQPLKGTLVGKQAQLVARSVALSVARGLPRGSLGVARGGRRVTKGSSCEDVVG